MHETIHNIVLVDQRIIICSVVRRPRIKHENHFQFLYHCDLFWFVLHKSRCDSFELFFY